MKVQVFRVLAHINIGRFVILGARYCMVLHAMPLLCWVLPVD